MAEYIVQDTTLINIANVIRAKTGKEDPIFLSDFSNEIGTIQAFEMELPVLDAAYPQDVNLTVIKGDTVSATFNVVFTAHGKPANYTYQWYVDGVAVEGANNSVFVKDNLANTVNHSIYCEITNEAGTVTTRVATLKVTQHYVPVLNASYPADVTLNDGSTTSATFKVQIDTAGNPTSYTYQWYVNGEAVSGATSASYTRSNLVKAETLTVYCKVTNAAGTIQSRTATLNVKHTFLYYNGTRYDNVTGGFKGVGKGLNSGSDATQKAPTVTYGTSSVKFSNVGDNTGMVYSNNKIDLTNHKTLRMKGVFYAAADSWRLAMKIWTGIGTYVEDNQVASWSPAAGNTAKQTVNIDISNLSGGHHIGAYIRNKSTSSSNYYADISEMVLIG